MNSYPIPQAEMDQFCRLPLAHQAEIRQQLRVFWAVDHAAHRERGEAWRVAILEANGVLAAAGYDPLPKLSALYARRQAFLAAGRDWAALVDRRKAPCWDAASRRVVDVATGGLPSLFIDFLKGLAQRHSRSNEQAIEELYRLWRAGEEVPGYGIWSSWWMREHAGEPFPARAPLPPGWGRRNLRRYMPAPAELAAARRGVAAALAKLPCIVRTREGLRPMEYVVLDDWRADFMVCVPGVQRPVELNGILAMDVASAISLRYGIRPALPKGEDGSEGLKRVDTRSLVADLLVRYGFPLDYPCNLIVENGTATITPADAEAIADVTSGQVVTHWTSMISGRVFGWEDRPVGNYRGKAWLESFFNLLHNAAGTVAGQIGAHYEDRPRSIPARERELVALQKATAALPAHLRETMAYRLPFPTLKEAKAALDFVFHFLNHRENHACEGFDQVLKVRLTESDPWRPVSDLLAQGQPRDALMALGPRPFVETPMERWMRLKRDVRWGRVPMSALPLLLAHHREVVVDLEGEVNLGSKSSPLIYRDRRCPHLVSGRKFLAYLSTVDGDWAHLVENGRYVCSVPKLHATRMADIAAAREQIAEKQAQLKRTLKQVQAVDLDAPQRLADIERNLRLAERQVAGQSQAIAPALQAVCAGVSESAQDVGQAEAALANEAARRGAEEQRVSAARGDLDDIYGRRPKDQEPDAEVADQVDAADALARLG